MVTTVAYRSRSRAENAPSYVSLPEMLSHKKKLIVATKERLESIRPESDDVVLLGIYFHRVVVEVKSLLYAGPKYQRLYSHYMNL